MAILNPDKIGEDGNAVENALSWAYPDLSLTDALEAKRSKLQTEHSRSEDVGLRASALSELHLSRLPLRFFQLQLGDSCYLSSGFLVRSHKV
ncbi:hypothetical protein CRG98_020741 [Punica granatum]|uniref:Uncharacterized protein n=1 Tax=Punica granatum TaxID=22663 RepID=A0A2I0JRD4_PUNGR|nr:hypothetical protein CRG98_020741 [Punica granatum]